jgi:hypothetical protein
METAMPTTHPSKQQVRNWMQLRQHSRLAPATPAEVRRQLGWELVRAAAGSR